MSKSKKTKYPLDRAKVSEAFQENRVSTTVYKNNPSILISVIGVNDENIVNDLQNAIDDVLKFHGK